jgi:hypothetical protein
MPTITKIEKRLIELPLARLRRLPPADYRTAEVRRWVEPARRGLEVRTRDRPPLARQRARNVAEAGVRRLVETNGGRRERIVLPPAVAAVAFGG